MANRMAELAKRITKRVAWGNVDDLDFREYVAREVVDRGMPVSHLARNHGIPSSTVRRWVDKLRAGGRAALEDDRPRGLRPAPVEPAPDMTLKDLMKSVEDAAFGTPAKPSTKSAAKKRPATKTRGGRRGR